MRATLEEWSHSLLQPPLLHPDLGFLAEGADEPAGIALCDPHPSAAGVGHVGVVGVRPPCRGRGLGLALLERAFAAFAHPGSAPSPLALKPTARPAPTGCTSAPGCG
jgi:GNAT superfamily N-acetyltransferase